jgi:hypothetical protein
MGRVGMATLLERIPDIQVVAGQDLVYRPAMTVLPLESLLVEWDAPA